MKEPSALEVGLFGASGAMCMGGGLLWTGLYGFPHHGTVGFVLFIGGMVAGTIFVALTDGGTEQFTQPYDWPPQ